MERLVDHVDVLRLGVALAERLHPVPHGRLLLFAEVINAANAPNGAVRPVEYAIGCCILVTRAAVDILRDCDRARDIGIGVAISARSDCKPKRQHSLARYAGLADQARERRPSGRNLLDGGIGCAAPRRCVATGA